MPKTKWMWNPCLDVQHQAQCQEYIDSRDGYAMITSWSDYKKGDELIIAGHGDTNDPRTMGGNDGTNAYEVDYKWIARALAGQQAPYSFSAWGRIAPSAELVIKLYMCTSADRKKIAGSGSDEKYCFAGLLLGALRDGGYTDVKIAAYHGELHWGQGHAHKIVCTRKVNPGTLLQGEKTYGLGIRFVARKGYGAARHRREWFTTKTFGTRWI